MCVTKGKCVTQGMSKMCHSGYVYCILIKILFNDKYLIQWKYAEQNISQKQFWSRLILVSNIDWKKILGLISLQSDSAGGGALINLQ